MLLALTQYPLGTPEASCCLVNADVPPLKALLCFPESLSLDHMGPCGSYENVPLPSPVVANIIDHSSSCGLLKSSLLLC